MNGPILEFCAPTGFSAHFCQVSSNLSMSRPHVLRVGELVYKLACASYRGSFHGEWNRLLVAQKLARIGKGCAGIGADGASAGVSSTAGAAVPTAPRPRLMPWWWRQY